MGKKIWELLERAGIIGKDGKFKFRVSMVLPEACPARYILTFGRPPDMTMTYGIRAHQKVESEFIHEGYIPEYELVIEDIMPEVDLIGHPDLLHPEKKHIIEIKYSRRVYPSHSAQLNTYLWMAMEKFGGWWTGEIMLVEADGRIVRRQTLFFNPRIVEEVKENIRQLYFAILKGYLPHKPSPLCRFCPLRVGCKEYIESRLPHP